MGTTLAMVIADAIGIMAGVVMRKHIPENVVKWISAAVFMLFGFIGVYKIISTKLNIIPVSLIMFGLTLITAVITSILVKKSQVET